ncbi:MAG TPA: hypothetical protein VGC19_10990 [Rhodanobacter sp.]
MNYAILDDEELLHLALEAMNAGKDADAVALLKALLERDPGNGIGHYLLAAQHAQMGLMDRAEAGFRAALACGLALPVARLQLGQLLVFKGELAQAKAILAPLFAAEDPVLAAYARALGAIGEGEVREAIRQLRQGLAQPQAIPALAADMHKLAASLEASAEAESDGMAATQAMPQASLYLSNYTRQG